MEVFYIEVRMIRRDCSFFAACMGLFVATMLFATLVAARAGTCRGPARSRRRSRRRRCGPAESAGAREGHAAGAGPPDDAGVHRGAGVQCNHCHVQAAAAAGGRGDGGGGRGGRGGGAPAFDYASDDKPQKKAARQMMLMVRDINPKVVAAVGKTEDLTARVGCATCHRGVAIPRTLAEVLDLTVMEKGAPAAIAQYKDLRKQYFGAQAYDFSEASLVAYAQRATNANKADDAIAWLQLNLEHFPLSSRTYVGLSQAQQKKNDKEAAIKSLEKAVELDPQNAQTKRQLDQLKGAPPPPQ